MRPNLEAAGATAGTIATVSAADANAWLQLAIGALTLAWWLRIWIRGGRHLKPPGDYLPPKGPPKDKAGRNIPILAAALASLIGGCAYNRPHFSETAPDGTHRELTVPTFAIWPATTELARQRAALGKTFTLGTEGLSEASGLSTNDVQALSLVLRILGK